jgi:hypothetical protein
MRLFLPAALAAALAAMPVSADEFTDVIDGALEAYGDGEITIAREELDYAIKLLAMMKSESLSGFLPEALPGWTKTKGDGGDGGGAAMAMLGGGTTASAEYSNGSNNVSMTLMADSPLVSGMAAMITGMASMGGGKPVRIQRTQFGINDDEMQGVVNKRVMVTLSGNASVEDKKAYLEMMDLKALGNF